MASAYGEKKGSFSFLCKQQKAHSELLSGVEIRRMEGSACSKASISRLRL